MSWFSKATGIHIGGNWGISKALNKGWNAIGGGILGTMKDSTVDRARSLLQGDMGGTFSGVTRQQAARAASEAEALARRAAHDAEVAQLSQAALGAVAMRRRKGMYASMFTGTPALSAPSTGKTLLSQ